MHSDRRLAALALRVVVIVGGLALWPPSSAHADWMLGAFLGHAATLDSTIVLRQPARQTDLELVGVEYRGESFRSPQYYGYRVAWIPAARRWMAIEGEVIHAKVFAETDLPVQMRGTLGGSAIDVVRPLSSIAQRLAMSHGLNFILANLALRRELGPTDAQGTRRLTVVLRAGAGPTVPHAESTIDGVKRDQYEGGGLGAQVGGGLEVVMARGLAVLGEYKFTWASPEIDVADGQAKVPARSHHVVAGLAYRF